jgi:hypothetical protein
LVALLTSACAGNGPQIGGFKIRLAATQHGRHTQFKAWTPEHMLFRTFEWFASLISGPTPLKAQQVPATLDDLSCFGVNVKGGGLVTANACGGMKLGSVDGFYDDIDSDFSADVPASDSLTIEAFGYQADWCDDWGSLVGSGDAGAIYRIGSIKFDASGQSGDAVIPVALNINDTFSCAGTPYDIFIDTFAYPNGNLGDPGVGDDSWLTLSTGIDVSTGALFPDAASGDNWLYDSVDVTNPFTSFQIDVNRASVLPTPEFTMGLSTDQDDAPFGIIGCSLDISTTGSPITISAGYDDSGTLTPTNIGTAVNPVSAHYTFGCDMQSEDDGSISVRAWIQDPITGYAEVINNFPPDVCGDFGCGYVFLLSNPGSGSFQSTTFGNFHISQAQETQF